MLDLIVSCSSRRNRAKIVSTMNKLQDIYLVGQAQAPGTFLMSEFDYGPDICKIILADAPPFAISLASANPRLFVDAGDPVLLAGSPSEAFRASYSVILELNPAGFLLLTDRQNFLAVTYTHEQQDHWVVVEDDDRPWWQPNVAWALIIANLSELFRRWRGADNE